MLSKAGEKDRIWDKYLRLHAEYDNSRKLWEKNKADLLKFGNFRILKECVVVLDEIEAALLNKSLSDTDRDDLEEEFEFWDKQLYEIADAIKHLNPSKYMMNKYLEIEHILTFT